MARMSDARNVSAGAERMRRHRERRQKGLMYLGIELRITEIDRLVSLGYLKSDHRRDFEKVLDALYWFLDVSLR